MPATTDLVQVASYIDKPLNKRAERKIAKEQLSMSAYIKGLMRKDLLNK